LYNNRKENDGGEAAALASRLLMVEDDPFLRQGLGELLLRERYEVDMAVNAAQAETRVAEWKYDLILLDVGLPDGDGIELCAKWRARGVSTPILFLTARDEEIQIVRGLDAGGNDYVVKPFRMLELLSRIRALLRRNRPSRYQNRGLMVDLERMSAQRDGKALYLTPIEFRILSMLIQSGGRILPRTLLLEQIWDMGGQFVDDNTLSVHMSRLREKIGPEYIRTVRGVGYQWEETP
jgi:two-component system response regulator RegX3